MPMQNATEDPAEALAFQGKLITGSRHTQNGREEFWPRSHFKANL